MREMELVPRVGTGIMRSCGKKWEKGWKKNSRDASSDSDMTVPQTQSQKLSTFQFSSVQLLSPVRLSATPWTAEARLPCPSSTLGVYSNSCPSSWWCHSTISSFVDPFSSCLQSFSASESFPMSQLFAWGGQSIGVSALTSVLPMTIQDSLPLGWTGWISLQSVQGTLKSLL